MILPLHSTEKGDSKVISAVWNSHLASYSSCVKVPVPQYPQYLFSPVPLLSYTEHFVSPSMMSVPPGLERAHSSDDLNTKARKPYTITKQRERWAEEEHLKFLEALRLYGRAWRRIEEHIGTKTAVQIRSHAQKFFSKLEREMASPNGTVSHPSLPDIDIPPPRPKRKPSHPYPRKAAANGSPGERERERDEDIGREEGGRGGRMLPRMASAPPTHLDCTIAATLAGEELGVRSKPAHGSGGFFPYAGRMQTGAGNLRSNLAGRMSQGVGVVVGGVGGPTPAEPGIVVGGGGGELSLGQTGNVFAAQLPNGAGSPGSVKLFGQTLVVPTAHRAASLTLGNLPAGLVRVSSSGDVGTGFRTGESAFVPRRATSIESGGGSGGEGGGGESGGGGGRGGERESERERERVPGIPSQSEKSMIESGLSMEGTSNIVVKEEGGGGGGVLGWYQNGSNSHNNSQIPQNIQSTQHRMNAQLFDQQNHHYRGIYSNFPPHFEAQRGPNNNSMEYSPSPPFEYSHSQYQMMAAMANPMEASLLHSPFFLPPSFPFPPPPRHHPSFAAYEAHLNQMASFASRGPAPPSLPPSLSPFGLWGGPGPHDPAAMAAMSMWGGGGGGGGEGGVVNSSPSPGEGEEGKVASIMAAASAWWALQGNVVNGSISGIPMGGAPPSTPPVMQVGGMTEKGKGGGRAEERGESGGGLREGQAGGEEGHEVQKKSASGGGERGVEECSQIGEGESCSPQGGHNLAKASGIRRAERASRLKELKTRRSPGGGVSAPPPLRPSAPLITTDSSPSGGVIEASPSAPMAASCVRGGVENSFNPNSKTESFKSPLLPSLSSSMIEEKEKEETENVTVTVGGGVKGGKAPQGKGPKGGAKGEKAKERRIEGGGEMKEGTVSPSLVEGEALRKRLRGRSISGSTSPLGEGKGGEQGEGGEGGEKGSSNYGGVGEVGGMSCGSDGSGGEGDVTPNGVGRDGDTSGGGGPSSHSSGCGNLEGKRGRGGSSDGGSSDGDGGDGPPLGGVSPIEASPMKEEAEREGIEGGEAEEMEIERDGEGERRERGAGNGGIPAGGTSGAVGGEGGSNNVEWSEKGRVEGGGGGGHGKGEGEGKSTLRHLKHMGMETVEARKEVSSEGRKAFHALFTRDTLPRDFSPSSWGVGGGGIATNNEGNTNNGKIGGGLPRAPLGPNGGPVVGGEGEEGGVGGVGVHHHYHYHYHSGSKSTSEKNPEKKISMAPSASSVTPVVGEFQEKGKETGGEGGGRDGEVVVKKGLVKVEYEEGKRDGSESPNRPNTLRLNVDSVSGQKKVLVMTGTACGSPGREKFGGEDTEGDPDEVHRQRLSMLRAAIQSGATANEFTENGGNSPPQNLRFGSGGGFQPYSRSNSGSPTAKSERKRMEMETGIEPSVDNGQTGQCVPLKKRPCPPVNSL